MEDVDGVSGIISIKWHHFQARVLFLEGAEQERRGQMHEAIRSYTRAVHLVPDIERRVFAPTNSKSATNQRSNQVRDVSLRILLLLSDVQL